MNEYSKLIQEDSEEQLRQSLYVAAGKQPETEAKLQMLAKRTGLPLEAVRLKAPEVEFKHRLESFDYEKVIKESPKLAQWLADPKNASIAHDDVESLGKLERVIQSGRDIGGSAGKGLVSGSLGSPLVGAANLYDVAARGLGNAIVGGAGLFGDRARQATSEFLNTPIPQWANPSRVFLRNPGQAFKGVGEAIGAPKERQNLATDVAEGVGQLGGQIATYLLTGGAATSATMLAQGADVMGEKVAKDNAPQAYKDTAMVAGGAITLITERYGLDKILNRVPPEIKNRTLRFIADKVAAGGIEAGQEVAEGLLHDLARRVTTNENAELLQGVEREATAAGLAAAIVRSALGLKSYRAAKQNEEFVKALAEPAAAANLRGRDAEKFRELVASYTENGPVQNVFIPAQKFAEYFQSANIDPLEAAQEAGALNFREALASGGDVVIPMADFITHIAPTDHLQGLSKDLRFAQDEMTARELELEEANRDENDRRLQEEVARLEAAARDDQSLDSAIREIVGDVEGQLAQRYDPQTAKQMATVMRGIAVLAQRQYPDMPPVEAARQLWRRYGLQVRANPLPDVLRNAPDFDAAIDPLLDRLRTGDVPTQGDAMDALGRTLSEMGVDLSQVDNATVKRMLLGEGQEFGQPLPDTIEVDGKQRPTTNSNGKPIAQTEEGVRNFWRWFGESKVVDADGRPLVVYHGSPDVRGIFAEGFKGFSRGNVFFATDSERVANTYADPKRAFDYQNAEENVIPLYVSIKNPLVIDAQGKHWRETEKFVSEAKAAGHDGIVIKNSIDDYNNKIGSKPSTVYAFFEPAQAKSALSDPLISRFDRKPIAGTGPNVGTFDPNDANILNQDKRGSIQFGADRQFTINLFEKADLSTFLHESGHFYLEVLGDLAADENASEQIKQDYQMLLNWFGVSNRDQITVEHHEKFARSNEAYLMEGKAPSPELHGAFQRFRAWLKMIYRQLSALNVELSDEVRGVFDRIYATDAEIQQASQTADIEHLFADAETAGMTEAEFKAYSDSVAAATTQAKEELQTKLMRVEKLKRERWWKDEKQKVAQEVAAEYDETKAAQAFAAMTGGGSEVKLSRSQLVERYGEQITKRLPRAYGQGRGAVYSDDGMDIDAVAELQGYKNADEMISELVNMPNRARYIAAESDRRMMERHGDILNDVAIADAAMEALHNEKREKVLGIELRALRKKVREAAPAVKVERDKAAQDRRDARAATEIPPIQSFRNAARGIISQKIVRDIQPYGYLVAERKASRAAFKAMANGDYVEATIQKQREVLNHFLYLEAVKAQKETATIYEYQKRFDKKETRQKLGLAGADYLDQIDALRARYEFARISDTQLRRRESLSAWLAKQEAEGAAVNVPQEVQDDARRVNYRLATMDELRAVYDAMRNIAHLANMKNKLIRKGKQVEFGQVVNELLGAIEAAPFDSTGELGRPNTKGLDIGAKGAKAWRSFDASMMKVEQIVEWLDSGEIDGPWARYFFDLADDAQSMEYDLHRMVTQRIGELNEQMPKEWRDSMFDRTGVRMPGFDNPLTKFDLLSIAMNMGNAENMQRLQDGYGWGDADMQAVRDAMTAQDWDFVQGVWDSIETLWPYMAELEKRQSGLEPVKVEPLSFEASGKTYRGGYFPLVYDPRKSNAGEKQAQSTESVEQFTQQRYGRASTNRGATKTRAENFAAPVMLDFEHVISGHVAKVIKDISHREAVLGLNKILGNEQIKNALIDKLGDDRYAELRKWMQVLVNDRSDTLHNATGPAKLMMKARTNMAIVTMGWKIGTALSQLAGFGPSSDVVKGRYLTSALAQAMKNPMGLLTGSSEVSQFVMEKSGEMRNRAATVDRDVKDALRRITGENGIVANVQRTAFYLTAGFDRMVSIPTWLGAYNQALAEGKTEEAAIRAGDRAVRLSQGAGGAKDLAAVQRNNELMRLLTMYYTPFSVLYSRLRDVGHQQATQGIGYLPKAVARLTLLVLIPAVLGDVLAGRGPDEDEDETWWAIRKMVLYPLASIPLLRDLSGFFEAGMIEATGEGKMKFPPSYKLSPIVSAIEKVIKTPGKIYGAMNGDKEWEDVAWDTFETSGYLFGLPTAQTRITGEYLLDLLNGDAEPENAGELMHDALFRRDRKDK